MYNILAILVGMLISIMITFNGQLLNNVGLSYSLLIIHIVGLIAIAFIMVLKRIKISLKGRIPLYLFLGGVVGVGLTISNILTITYIGVALTTALGVFGQLIFSSLVDHYGFLGMTKYNFNKKKLIGFSIIFIGLIVMTI
ncbi:transporter family-2 protein [Clostridium cavendishii DSM 21758]|uniref:Transporter family-2 protein n=1 Tax=Clostridium cavendishii DSM 21758 TaxID=1121302 RepID=A0A1M6FMD5_9CLOT|nr:DMT family transporter [Clostridium cavendishii]SHI98846.1 transporter family-2 protein [Clostridium cavendishii DSM 21758]